MIYVKIRRSIWEKVSPAAKVAAKDCGSDPVSEKEIPYA